MAKRGRRNGASADDWLPREQKVDLPKERLSVSQRVKRLVLWTVLLTFPLSTLVAFSAIQMAAEKNDAAPSSSAAVNATSPGRFVATRTLEQWLAGDPSPLPGGRIVSWDGATTRPAPLDADGVPVARWTSSTENFTLADEAGNQFRSAVQVAVDPRGGAKVLSAPTLLPMVTVAQDGWVSESDKWPGLSTEAVSDAMKASIGSWATAFMSGNADALRLAVGDTDPNRMYVPLPAMTVVETLVDSAVRSSDGVHVIARALVRYTIPGAVPSPGRSTVKEAEAVYDVLLARPGTAAPSVVAWGAPGTGPALTPFSNGVAAANRDPLASLSPTTPTAPTSDAKD